MIEQFKLDSRKLAAQQIEAPKQQQQRGRGDRQYHASSDTGSRRGAAEGRQHSTAGKNVGGGDGSGQRNGWTSESGGNKKTQDASGTKQETGITLKDSEEQKDQPQNPKEVIHLDDDDFEQF